MFCLELQMFYLRTLLQHVLLRFFPIYTEHCCLPLFLYTVVMRVFHWMLPTQRPQIEALD